MVKDAQGSRQDQRVRVTKAMLHEAILTLLAQKPARSITVKELCALAGVNRGTFYLHYTDIFALVEEIENNMLQDLNQLLAESPVIRYDTTELDSHIFVTSLLRFFEKNKEMLMILLGENGDKQFVQKIIEMGREKSVTQYKALYPDAPPQKAGMFYAFAASGVVGLIQYGIQQGNIPLGQIAAAAQSIIAQSTRFFQRDDFSPQ